ncbi:MAG TPA: hypothetical protein VGC42_24635, partial [Kofleriaceae bacterium]
MRSELAALAAILVSPPARAELRVLIAADSYLATTPGYSTDSAADTALAAHVEARSPERDLIFDGVDRESLIHGAPRRELHELAYVERGVAGLELTLGRFRVPGGFWLIADGGGAALRAGDFTAGVYGGSRAFTNGRADTLLTAHPAPLPLAGAAITHRGELQAALSYTYTADRVVLPRGNGLASTRRTPEQFLDAELATAIGEHGFLTFGASAGSRYLVTYPSVAQVTADPTLDNVWFGSQAAYAMLDWKLEAWRLDLTAAALRTKLGQEASMALDTETLAAIDGSFVEATARAAYRPDRTLRLDGRYRLRAWADGGTAHRAQLDGEWRRGELAVQARVGVDVHRGRDPAPGLVDSASVFYQASLGRKTGSSELAVGAAAVSSI